MTVRLYRHDDTSAPVLTGQAGSLTTLLDAVLVNGYGSKTAAGWSINQTTTNKRGYKQGAGGNHPSGILCYIDDASPGPAGAREARVCGFETMSAITPVGTGQFPNSSQSNIGAGYLCIRKSNTNDSTARKWYIVADAWTFYLFIEMGDGMSEQSPGGTGTAFGDFKSFKTGDAYAQILIARTWENNTDPQGEAMPGIVGDRENWSVNSNMAGHFCSRHWNQSVVSPRCGKNANTGAGQSWGHWNGDNQQNFGESRIAPGYMLANPYYFPYPNPVDGSLWMAPFYVNQNGMRGYLKGFWCPQHHMPLNPGDTFTAASGNLSGKSFIAVNSSFRHDDNSFRPSQMFLEFSDTWP